MSSLNTDLKITGKSNTDVENNLVDPRPDKKAIKQKSRKRKQLFRELREKQRREGLTPPGSTIIYNRKSDYETPEEERQDRNEVITDIMKMLIDKLPVFRKRFEKIKDPRNPKKIKYKVTVLGIYGILTFVFHMASRREANREMTRPMFMENLKQLIPELGDLPHNDTLARFLAVIDVNEIENAQVDLVNRLIRNKKFKKYLIDNCYPIAFDGSQKFARDSLWSQHCSERMIKVNKEKGKGKESKKQYYVYVLEASLAFRNGMTIPLMSEFADYIEGYTESEKQDCEQKAFKRLAKRIKKRFPKLKIMALLDGLYPNGPMIELIQKYKWDAMIVLQSKSLPSVWAEFHGLKKLLPANEHPGIWGGRHQRFKWVNDIDYYYGGNDKNRLKFHMVICDENWEEVAKDSNKIVPKTTTHAWISLKPLNRRNLHERCNLGARHRWNIEHGFLVEKHHGYQYEHCFSYDWNAMKGFHYLMRIGHIINVLVQFSERFFEAVQKHGVRGFIKFIRETLGAPWLDPEWVKKRLLAPFQLKLRE